jgi:hypothetical protein
MPGAKTSAPAITIIRIIRRPDRIALSPLAATLYALSLRK